LSFNVRVAVFGVVRAHARVLVKIEQNTKIVVIRRGQSYCLSSFTNRSASQSRGRQRIHTHARDESYYVFAPSWTARKQNTVTSAASILPGRSRTPTTRRVARTAFAFRKSRCAVSRTGKHTYNRRQRYQSRRPVCTRQKNRLQTFRAVDERTETYARSKRAFINHGP